MILPNIWKVKKKHVPNHQPGVNIYIYIIYIYVCFFIDYKWYHLVI